jgi:hypothetical protein
MRFRRQGRSGEGEGGEKKGGGFDPWHVEEREEKELGKE